MADETALSTRAPWHLWLIGALSLLWNAVGAVDFTMTQLKNEAYLKAFTPAQLEYFYSFPFWVVAAWAIGTWGSVVGSVLLLFRQGVSVVFFFASLLGILLTALHNYLLSDGIKVMGGGAGMVVFSAVIFVIGLLLFIYARAIRLRGVLN